MRDPYTVLEFRNPPTWPRSRGLSQTRQKNTIPDQSKDPKAKEKFAELNSPMRFWATRKNAPLSTAAKSTPKASRGSTGLKDLARKALALAAVRKGAVLASSILNIISAAGIPAPRD